VVQVILGMSAWIFLASVLSSLTRYGRTAFALTLVLGLSPQVIRYDVAMLSESLSITFAVTAVAATLYRLRTKSMLSAVIWCTALTMSALSRPTHLIVVAVCLLPSFITFVRSRGRKVTLTMVALLTLFMAGIVSLRTTSHVSLLNMYTVVSSRVLSDENRFSWFVERGMPNIPNMRSATGYDYAGDLPPDVAAVVQLPVDQQPPQLMRVGGVELATWLKDNGWRTLAQYLITHPTDALSHASPCAALIAGLVQRQARSMALLIAGFLFATWSIYFVTVHTSGIEHVRHATTVSTMIRVLGLVSLVALLPEKRTTASLDEHGGERSQ